MKRRAVLRGIPAGVLCTLALPPFGWWPLALLGAAWLAVLLERRTFGRRFWVAAGFGIGFVVPGLFWMTEFSIPGAVLAMLLESSLVALFVSAAPPGRWQLLGFPAAFALADAFRGWWPWGGVPIATLAETQIGGPLAQIARIGGMLAVASFVGVAAQVLASIWRRRGRRALGCAAVLVAVVITGLRGFDGTPGSTLRASLVQGGGKRGTRAIDTARDVVLNAHLDATAQVPDGVDLILWPEDVVDVDDDVLTTPQGDRIAGLAAMHQATLVAGVVSGKKKDFFNVARVWNPDGTPGEVYEKNHRVPFGEWIPLRSIVSHVADLSAVPRDAHVGHGPGILDTRAGHLGVVISYEVFFPARARSAIRAGGTVLLVPTNASSYSSTQMPALELGAARLRAIETGRNVLQAAPTGFSAVIDQRGRVHQHTDLGTRAVLTANVPNRNGLTPYTRLGDKPFVLAAALALLASWLLTRRAGR